MKSLDEYIGNEQDESAILSSGLVYADAFVNKNYLVNLNNYPVATIDDDFKTHNSIRLFKLEQIVYDQNEDINDKLISVFSALSSIGCNAILIIDSTNTGVDYYIGIRSEENASTAGKIFEKSLKGNFPGSILSSLKISSIATLLEDITSSDIDGVEKNVSSVSIVPSTRDDNKDNFVQGIEKFIDAMHGETYTAIIIATPLSADVLESRKRGLENLHSTLSPYSNISLAYGENESKSVTTGMTKSFASGITDSVSDTNSTFDSSSFSRSSGRSHGHSFGFLGMGYNSGVNSGFSKSYSSGQSWAKAVTEGKSETTTEGSSSSDTETIGSSRTLTISRKNKSVQNLMDKIDEHLKRIKGCEAFGLWDCAGYFISDDIQTSVVAANTYKALMAGNNSSVEKSFVNIWSSGDGENTSNLLEYMKYCLHPGLLLSFDPEGLESDTQVITPASLISGNEIPLIMGLPRKSVNGVTARSVAEFGRNVFAHKKKKNFRKLNIGRVYHMGMTERSRVILDMDSLTSHCFITGSTGSGKSNTSYKIIDELIEANIPFMVIEPAKGEYKRYYGALPGLNVFTTNPRIYSMLRINPFKFDSSIHILEHLDRLIEIFNACWPLYAAMPAILKQAFEGAYIKCGWDLNKSVRIENGSSIFPTFRDVLEILPIIINQSSYSADSKGDYIGALVTRVNSLTNGILGQVFCANNDIDDETLFDQNTIIDLSRIGAAETKSLIMGILVLKLNEYRMSFGQENAPLSHVTIIEEAHNLLKRSSSDQSVDGANLQGKSVEMISSAIAEMRTFGEGFIIIDQSPTAVDVSAIKNTNTKIIMRLPDNEDCEIAGKSMGLNAEQIAELAKLQTGVAAIYQNDWVESVLTHVDKSNCKYYQEDIICNNDIIAELKGRLSVSMIYQYENENGHFDLESLRELVITSGIPVQKKSEIMSAVVTMHDSIEKADKVTNKLFCKLLYEFIECDGLFNAIPIKLKKPKANDYSDICDDDIIMSRNWYDHIIQNLEKYAYVEDKVLKDKLFQYLLFHVTMVYNTDRRYDIAYYSIFRL